MSRLPPSRGRVRDDDDDDRHPASDGSDASDAEDDDGGRSSRSGAASASAGGKKGGKSRGGAGGSGIGSDDPKRKEITTERTVIHESLIRRAIHKELKTYYDAAVVPLEHDLDLKAVDKLVLSYCNIYKIDNLAGFEHLTQLKLDNNIIERIENLSHLTNLRWLDLSFNHLTRISGLEALVHLTDLSLFDNEISVIEGLDTLTKLNVLSLGNNQIADLSSVVALRKFKQLRLLNLKGNPVCQHDDYHNTVFAYLTNLKYLDYVVIESSQFAKARDAKLDQLLVLEAKEKAEEAAAKEAQLSAEQQKQLDDANLQGLSTLFADMIRADSEHPKIRVLPGFEPLQNQYKAAFTQIVDEFSSDILSRHRLKASEKETFDKVLAKVHATAEEESKAEIARYAALKKKTLAAYADSVDRGRGDALLLQSLRGELQRVVHRLMDVEMLLVEQVESLVEEFEKAYLKLLSDNVLRINAAFRALIDTCNKHTGAVYDLTHHLLERLAKDDHFTDDVDVKAILADKDVLNNAVSTSHENQEGRIAAKEDEVREREEGNGKKLIRDLRTAHRLRNRKRVAEIHEFKAREEAKIAEEEEQQEDDEEP